MEIKGFIENSLIEWEGMIASVLFLPGCNLRCRYCHAARLVLHPDRAESIPVEQVLACMRLQVGWLDGAVISGGEPTLHGERLIELIREIRRIPMRVMVETNGTRPAMVERLIADGLVEAFAMDLKAPLTAHDYERVAGVPVQVDDIARSLGLIKESGLQHEVRITVVPGLVGLDELRRMVPALEGVRQVAHQNFRPEFALQEALRQVSPYTPEEMDSLERVVTGVAWRCVVRGRQYALARSKAG